MKQDMNKLNSFNLTQFEWRIQNLINLQVKRKNLNVAFPATIILNTTIANQSIPHFSVIFFGQCALLIVAWLFIVPIFYQLTSEKNQVHTCNLTHCRQTLQLIKFYLIKNMKGNGGNYLAQFKFPFIGFLDSARSGCELIVQGLKLSKWKTNMAAQYNHMIVIWKGVLKTV